MVKDKIIITETREDLMQLSPARSSERADDARKRWDDGGDIATIQPAGVLVVDQSTFMRGLVAGYLELAGHKVYEAGAESEALAKVAHCPIRVAMVSANLPGNGQVFKRLRRRTREAGIALIGLADDCGEISPDSIRNYDAFHFKSERQAILQSVKKLSHGIRAR
jgi:CheY-like chemotaxis protein